MTENVKSWFVPKFEQTVQHQFQQPDVRLGDTVAGGGTFVGDNCYFPRMGAVDAYENIQFAKLALANVGQDFISVQAKARFVAFGLYDPNKNKLSINTAVEYGKSAYMAIKRAEDDAIITALALAAANGVSSIGDTNVTENMVTIGDYNTPATLDLVAEGVANLGEQEAFAGQKVTIVAPFRNKTQFALDPYMAKSDVKDNLPWNDLNWRQSERLPKDAGTGGRDIFLYARDSVVSAYNDKLTAIDERDGAALTDIIGYWLQVGAAVRNVRGIVRIKTKGNFSLSRQPIPTHAV